MDKEWITVNELALVKGVSSRAVRKSIKNKDYIIRKRGNKYEILISTLEANLQQDIRYRSNTNEIIEQNISIDEEVKKIALARYEIVSAWRKFKENYKGNKWDSVIDFMRIYSVQEKKAYKIVNVSPSTMFRWDKKLKNSHEDWQALVNRYIPPKKGTYLSDKEQKIFLSLLLHPNQTNIGKAVKLTKHILKEQGYTKFASEMTYRRFIKEYKEKHYDVWVFSREGTKALRDRVVPYIERDLSKIEVGDIIVGDGHRLAFQVINPFTGSPCRPLLVAYQDWKSGGLVGFEIMLEENTQCIASALRNAIINLGKIPKYVYQDNGKAFKSNYFINTDGITGLFVKLGITPIFAKPYNAKAKVIERFFREMQDSFERLLPSFVGSNIYSKPAYLKRNEKFHKENHIDYIPTIEETLELINKWLCFHYSQPCPNNKHKSIGEVLDAGRGAGVDIKSLDDLMMVTEIKRIGRNGIRFLKSDYYDESLYGLRTSVVIKYSLFDLSYIKVYLTNGQFLCVAKRLEAINPIANYVGEPKDIEELKQRIKQQKQLEKQTIKAYLTEMKKDRIYLPTLEETNYNEFESLDTRKEIVQNFDDIEENKPIAFTSNYERYDFLKNQEALSDDEKNWLEKYAKSDEYKLIYD